MAVSESDLLVVSSGPFETYRFRDPFKASSQDGVFFFAIQWVLRVRETIPAAKLNTQGPDRLLRIAQILALSFVVVSIIAPDLRANHFSNVVLDPGEQVHWSFWLFAVPLGLSILVGTAGSMVTLFRRPDRAEVRHLISFALGAPTMAGGMVLPPNTAPLASAVGLLVLLIGSVQSMWRKDNVRSSCRAFWRHRWHSW